MNINNYVTVTIEAPVTNQKLFLGDCPLTKIPKKTTIKELRDLLVQVYQDPAFKNCNLFKNNKKLDDSCLLETLATNDQVIFTAMHNSGPLIQFDAKLDALCLLNFTDLMRKNPDLARATIPDDQNIRMFSKAEDLGTRWNSWGTLTRLTFLKEHADLIAKAEPEPQPQSNNSIS